MLREATFSLKVWSFNLEEAFGPRWKSKWHFHLNPLYLQAYKGLHCKENTGHAWGPQQRYCAKFCISNLFFIILSWLGIFLLHIFHVRMWSQKNFERLYHQRSSLPWQVSLPRSEESCAGLEDSPPNAATCLLLILHGLRYRLFEAGTLMLSLCWEAALITSRAIKVNLIEDS